MSWKSALKKTIAPSYEFRRPAFPLHPVDWARLVTVDFETYFDQDYTLKKMSTSEYVRDPRFKIQMVGIKIGTKPTKIYDGKRGTAALKAINWSTHSLLCHNTAFDGFIMSHHMGIVPATYYDTLSMARGLHSNEIGAGLDEVAKFYNGEGKIDGFLEKTKGVVTWPKELFVEGSAYCARDNDECFRIFQCMHAKYPAEEMGLIDLTIRMFCDPVLKVDIPRVEAEYAREIERREKLFYGVINPEDYDLGGQRYDKELHKKLIKGPAERELEGTDRGMHIIKRLLGNNEFFADLLRTEGAEPPTKVSKAWIAKPVEDRDDDSKYSYAFAKDDLEFTGLPDNIDLWRGDLDPNKKADIPAISARQDRLRGLIDARLAVKSTTNITRAERFLEAGKDGMSLPVGYSYYRAHTGRWGGNNKMNMQNLTRGGELRLSILAPKGHQIAVQDSGQIEARVNGWLWGQEDLLQAFRDADAGIGQDAYCNFAEAVYGYPVTKDAATKTERFVGKVCVLGLGFQMGAAKLQITFAKGALGGPPIFFELDRCKAIVNTYRTKNNKIRDGWSICARIIEDMAAGREGSHGPLNWEKETIWLPNGMALKYPDLRKSINIDSGWEEWTYASKDQRKKIYGGLLCENIVQALARIIVGWQMLQIGRKYRVVMTTHDEVVNCVKNSQAEAWDRFSTKIMKTAPSWCADIPLNCEGGYADNYSK